MEAETSAYGLRGMFYVDYAGVWLIQKKRLTRAADFLYDICRQLNIRFSIPESHLEWPRDGPSDATTTARQSEWRGQVPIPTRYGGDERGPLGLQRASSHPEEVF